MLHVGEHAPALVKSPGQIVETIAGEPVSLARLLSHGPLLLVFLRGFS